MTRVESLVKFIKDNSFSGLQTFNTCNIFGDSLITVYEQDGITLNYCNDYGYLEIFFDDDCFLDEEEESELRKVLDCEW